MQLDDISEKNVKLELLATIKAQEELINQQNETIMALVNETVEQENFIIEALKKDYQTDY